MIEEMKVKTLVLILALGFIALSAIVCYGAVVIRRHNEEIMRLRTMRPVNDKRWRALNVIDRCDRSPGCHAKWHEVDCARGRVERT